ncbi:hypothetical protein K402DRAFT_300849, partial [Aulographum hederae CBS 113979]
ILSAVFALTSSVSAHSWVEQSQVISENGSYVGNPGYSRGYFPRQAGVGADPFMSYQLPQNSAGRSRVTDQDLLCSPRQRTAGNQTAGYPKLTAEAGNYVALKYLENGHVTLPQNQAGKEGSGGTVYTFATTQPKNDEKLTEVLKWTADGKGGDRRGKLLTQQNFDDGRCYQINASPISTNRQAKFPNPTPGQAESKNEQWCESNFQIPKDIANGDLTVYWVWDWHTKPNVDPGLPKGKDEFYTTCQEISV